MPSKRWDTNFTQIEDMESHGMNFQDRWWTSANQNETRQKPVVHVYADSRVGPGPGRSLRLDTDTTKGNFSGQGSANSDLVGC